jgi:hypothetical protein
MTDVADFRTLAKLAVILSALLCMGLVAAAISSDGAAARDRQAAAHSGLPDMFGMASCAGAALPEAGATRRAS